MRPYATVIKKQKEEIARLTNQRDSYAKENQQLRAALKACIPYVEGGVGDPIAIIDRAEAALNEEMK